MSAYGLSISYSKNGLKSYWRKRIISVLIPYIIVEIITIFLRNDVSMGSFILDILLIKPQFRLGWYLNYLFLWYIIFYVVNLLKITDRSKMLIFTALSIILLIYFLPDNKLKVEQSFSFLIGLIIAKYDIKKYINKRVCISLLLVGLFVLALKQTDAVRNLPPVGLCIVDLLIKFTVPIGILELLYMVYTNNDRYLKNVLIKIIRPIGIVSYELYLVHGCALYIFDFINNKALGVICFVAVCAAFTIVLYYIDRVISGYLKKLILKN